MTTITTTDHRRTPLLATLAIGAAFVAGGVIGVAWDQHHSTPNDHHAPAVFHARVATPRSFGGVTTRDEISGSVTGHVHAPASPGGATTAQESTG